MALIDVVNLYVMCKQRVREQSSEQMWNRESTSEYSYLH